MFCPNWIFQISVARVASEYLSSELDILVFAKKYSDGLSKLYDPLPVEAFTAPTEQIIVFLGEIEAGESAVELLQNYTYYRLYFEALNSPRKLKSMFGSIEDGVKVPLEPMDSILKSLRAYIFGLRSGTVPIPPSGWKLEDDEHIPNLAAIISKSVSILDAF
ncbi:hypothetical protein OAW28_05665 [Alphaproteobacteria bacterium]|nr:hypothetical protein [Alphaproteobacteria bacterium]